MSTYTPPDKIEIYAAALHSDINSERFQQVVNSKLETYWVGTVYGGGVATELRGAHVQVAQCVGLRSGAVIPVGPVGKRPVGKGLV